MRRSLPVGDLALRLRRLGFTRLPANRLSALLRLLSLPFLTHRLLHGVETLFGDGMPVDPALPDSFTKLFQL